MFDECKMPPQVITSYPTAQLEMTLAEYDVYNYFIEDEHHWRFAVHFFVNRSLGTELTADTSEDGRIDYIPTEKYGETFNELYEDVLIQSGQKYILYHRATSGNGWGYGEDFNDDPNEPAIITYEERNYPDLANAIFWMQDGYYYKLFPPEDGFQKFEGIYKREIYNPKKEKIWVEVAVNLGKLFLATKIGKDYLCSLGGIPFFIHSDGTYTYIIPSSGPDYVFYNSPLCNQRLRPMKKYKGWQNRIQKITLAKK